MSLLKVVIESGQWWLTLVILVTWEAELKRIIILGHFRQKTKCLQDIISIDKSWAWWHTLSS
jgi:hypothetical protein